MNRLDDGWAEGDVVDEVAVHDIEVHPVGTRVDGASGFICYTAKIGGEERGGDDSVG